MGVWLAVSLVIFTCFDWPQLIKANWSVSGTILGDEIVLLLPILIPLILSWATFYDVDQWLSGETTSRPSYVWARVRLLLLPAVAPILLVSACSDVLDLWFPDFAASPWGTVFRFVPLLAVLLAYPSLLRSLWRTRPLHSTKLRRQLLQIAASRDVPIDDILLWDTNGQIVNAVACGLLPRRGCILLSDGLLERLDDQDVVEIFRHELGHLTQFHGLRLIICVISALSAAVSIALLGQSGAAAGGVDGRVLASFCVVLMAFLAVGRYSCLLEFEADLWAATDGVYGRRRYLRALEKLAEGVEDRRGWLHPSLAQRRAILEAPRQPVSARLEIRLRVTEFMLIFAPWIVAVGAMLVNCG